MGVFASLCMKNGQVAHCPKGHDDLGKFAGQDIEMQNDGFGIEYY